MKYILFGLIAIFCGLIAYNDIRYKNVKFWLLFTNMVILALFMCTMRDSSCFLVVFAILALLVYSCSNLKDILDVSVVDFIYAFLVILTMFMLRSTYKFVPVYYLIIPLVPAAAFCILYKGKYLPFLGVCSPLIIIYTFWSLVV